MGETEPLLSGRPLAAVLTLRISLTLLQMARGMKPTEHVLVNLSGRGDKDMHTVAKIMGVSL